MKAQKLICLVIGHGYTDQRVYSDEEAQHSVCKRCGHRRYKPPSDFLGVGQTPPCPLRAETGRTWPATDCRWR